MRDRLYALETFGIKLGLENITRLCAALGHPERAFTSLHIAGTNGKGSVAAFTHAALRAAGIHAARYTSPHLARLEERFVIDDAVVDAERLDEVGTDVLDAADRLLGAGHLGAPPTFFEATTAIAFELFRRAAVDVAVIEVGLGGRFDATNVITPAAGAITTIGLDHQQHLGDTLRAIAFEKAGIIKPGMTLVVGAVPAEAEEVIAEAAHDRHATLIRAHDDVDVDVTFDAGRATVTLQTPTAQYGPVTLALRGEHQVGNAVVALRLLEAAGSRVRVSPRDIEAGLSHADWPARLEMLTLTSGRRLLLDAAHNVEGAQALAAYLRRWHPERPPLVIGVMADKDVDGILGALLPVTSLVIATAVGNRRAMPARALADRVRAVDPERRVDVVAEHADALARALQQPADVVCVAGSIYLAGAIRDAARRRAILH